jgi:hypothetical protein
MPIGSEYVRLSGWTESAWTAVRSTRMTHSGHKAASKSRNAATSYRA